MCLEFVCVFRHCCEKFLSGSSDFPSSQKQDLHIPIRSETHKHFKTTINRWKNLDPLHQNRRWENSAFFPSGGFILDFFFCSRREGLLFHFILSKIGVLEFLSFSWVNKLHLFYHPLYSVIWCWHHLRQQRNHHYRAIFV